MLYFVGKDTVCSSMRSCTPALCNIITSTSCLKWPILDFHILLACKLVFSDIVSEDICNLLYDECALID